MRRPAERSVSRQSAGIGDERMRAAELELTAAECLSDVALKFALTRPMTIMAPRNWIALRTMDGMLDGESAPRWNLWVGLSILVRRSISSKKLWL